MRVITSGPVPPVCPITRSKLALIQRSSQVSSKATVPLTPKASGLGVINRATVDEDRRTEVVHVPCGDRRENGSTGQRNDEPTRLVYACHIRKLELRTENAPTGGRSNGRPVGADNRSTWGVGGRQSNARPNIITLDRGTGPGVAQNDTRGGGSVEPRLYRGHRSHPGPASGPSVQ